MSELYRFGISIPKDLIESFDQYIREKQYTNRSEAIRDLIREKLVKRDWDELGSDKEVVGAIVSVYDHHKRELLALLTEIQHEHYQNIISSQHAHLDHDNCLEVIIVKGKAKDVRLLGDKIKSIKGIKHSQLTMTTTGKDLV
ncbi:MAG: nickel-responsive transcriptional regulator NikR [Spirochaetes bacterium]|nr:nickel-responsive transcriptional regulator NikR [Deltaproteobacteria bacterium]RKY03684.1 MAG: nickel-responsive transcriptional regulator NikR [Spirochaetota bacterium]